MTPSTFRIFVLFVVLSGAFYTAPDANAQMARGDVEAATFAIHAVMAAQSDAWNDGKIREFMDGYSHTGSLLFLSGGNVQKGWEETYARYVRSYPDREAMGTLSFSDLSVRVLSDSYALVHGRWRLQREEDAPGGLFTLLFAREGDDWRIVHDHTSSE